MATGPLIESVHLAPGALLALHAAAPAKYPALFESAAVGRPLGRFDILFARPRSVLTLQSDRCLTLDGRVVRHGAFLRELDAWAAREGDGGESAPLPFTGGWLIYLGYELAGEIEPRLRLPAPTRGPIAQALRVPAALVHEHATGDAWIVAEPEHSACIEAIKADLAAAPQWAPASGCLLDGNLAEEEPQRFLRAVERALEYIAAGDVYQANLSRAWRGRARGRVRAADVYQRLRRTNPGPFSGIAELEGLSIISSSPERLVEVRGRSVATRPIAGTRPRGADAQRDRALAAELHGHPKERAEHVMLIDLERNDLGRVCAAGSVHVDEFMTIESYAHVHHIVSNVSGRLREDATPGEVLAAVFPGGTITGCPKIRCMEIIAELEGEARGPYTGALGYLNRNGDMDLNILIRSIAMNGRDLTLRAGAGVVADSIPERELAETRAKARGVLHALGEAP
jgi:anthranilate synthase component 1